MPLVGSGTDCQLLAVAEADAVNEYVLVIADASVNVVVADVAAVTKKLESSWTPTVSRMTAYTEYFVAGETPASVRDIAAFEKVPFAPLAMV